MAEDIWRRGDSEKFTVSAVHTDLLLYKSWRAESKREHRQRAWWGGWEWVATGDPLPISVRFEDSGGAPVANPAPAVSEGIYREEHLAVGAVPSTDPVNTITSMRVFYEWEGEKREIPVGRDPIGPPLAAFIIAVILIVILIVILALAGAAGSYDGNSGGSG
ncbi:MAG TPA: hypothetical protein VD846_08185 [Allosphingosinicella sp.]|nr:hypothetical protein [Allosphingosinicella sp.]